MLKPYSYRLQPTNVGSAVANLITFKRTMRLKPLRHLIVKHRFIGSAVRAAIALMVVGVAMLPGCASADSTMPPNSSTASLTDPKTAPKTASEWVKRGIEQAKENDLEGAIAAFDQAIQLKRDDALAYYNRGTVYANLGNRRSALADYTQVILLKPNNAYVRYNRGLLRVDARDKDGAIADFQQAAMLFKQQLNLPWQQNALDKVTELQQP